MKNIFVKEKVFDWVTLVILVFYMKVMILGFCKPFGPVVYFNVTDFSFRAAFSFPLASVLYFINPQF